MPTSSTIIVLGSINTDLVIRGRRLPAPGETVIGGEFYQAAGGKGANQAVAAARAALEPVTFIGAVGDDNHGRDALDRFKTENLAGDYIKVVPGAASGVALILVDDAGQNLISVASGANARLTPQDVDAIPDAVFRDAKVFLTCLETPLDTVARGLMRAKRAGLVTILNPAPASHSIIDAGLLKFVDVLTPNAGEAALLAGVETAGDDAENESNVVRAARALQSLGCRQVIVTRGARGCLIVDEQVRQIAGRDVCAIDATTAGDAFNGALAVALAEEMSLFEAAGWSNAAAAISVTRKGAQPSLPRRSEIEHLLKSGM